MAGPAGAGTILLTGVTSTTGWSDVYQGAGNFCWLASASNMLSYAGWDGGASLTSAIDIFNYSTPYWANVDGNPYWDVQWWFDGVEGGPSAGGLSGGGNFYSQALFQSSFAFAEDAAGLHPADLYDYITTNVSLNRVFSLLTGDSSSGVHFVTGWGYETNASGVAGVYYTDSFNVGGGLEYSTLTCTDFNTGRCNFDNFAGLFVTSSSRLTSNSGNIDPNHPPDPGTNPVPEPSTLILFGSGLLAVVSRRRKK
jgi:hypothetical protein